MSHFVSRHVKFNGSGRLSMIVAQTEKQKLSLLLCIQGGAERFWYDQAVLKKSF